MASNVQRYFERNAGPAPWYDNIQAIRVERGVISIETDLDLPDEQTVEEICSTIQGSDEADFTPGHSVIGSGGATAECPTRTE